MRVIKIELAPEQNGHIVQLTLGNGSGSDHLVKIEPVTDLPPGWVALPGTGPMLVLFTRETTPIELQIERMAAW
jgi:hypothetical protein